MATSRLLAKTTLPERQVGEGASPRLDVSNDILVLAVSIVKDRVAQEKFFGWPKAKLVL